MKRKPKVRVVKKVSTKEQIAKDLTVRNLTQKKAITDKKYKSLLAENERLNKILESAHSIKDIRFHSISHRTTGGSEATAVALASDWHSEEIVRISDTNGKNEFNLKIFEKRADLFFANLVKLITAKQKNIKIKTLVLALLGDYITSNIHEESVEVSALQPVEALINAQNKIASGIRFLLDNSNVSLVIPCHSGNHARITKKQRNATESGNSLEYVMYHNLANTFRNEKRVKFIISPSYHSYLNVCGFKIRFHHGHDIRYAGGIGGLTIPANKAIANWNTIETADLDCFGHFHQQFYGGNFICNGSLIGFNAYAVAIKARFERPRQAFFLVNHERKEITDYCPVWLT